MADMTLKEMLASVLADFPEISLVYLFGSRVSGQVGPLSDTDLAIDGEIPEDHVAFPARVQHALTVILNTERVDVVLLSDAPIDLAYHIIATGELLYQKDVYTRVEVEARILSLYGDYLPVLRMFKDQTLRGETDGKRVQRYREALERTRRALGQTRSS